MSVPRRHPLSCAVLAPAALFALLGGCQAGPGEHADTTLASGLRDDPWFRGPTAEVISTPMDPTGRRPNDVGPPPPGHPRIVGDTVPDWRADRVYGTDAELLDAGNPLAWVPVGPRPIIGEYWSGNDDASGRVVGIAPHPSDPDTVFIASASGGAWRTTDGGDTWMPLTDELPTTNGGAIALDPSNPEIVYLGTGEYQTGSLGAGVFRSLDGGDTWDVFAPSSITGTRTSTIHVDPTDPLVVHIAGDGYHRTTDGGVSWDSSLDGPISGLVLDPVSPDRLIAARADDGLHRSLDGGASWTPLTVDVGEPVNRIVLAIAASQPDVVYAAFAQGGGVLGTWRTFDFGSNWTRLDNTPSFAAPQAWYDMYLAVDPTDPFTVYAGGVSPIYAVSGILRSTTAGNTWEEISFDGTVQTHPDHHVMAFGPGGRIWEGNDGGVWRSDDGGDSWVNRNGTLAITQQYTVGISPHPGAAILGGTQDNGSIERSGDDDAWPQLIGGDGGFLAYDHEDPAVKYTTYVYLRVQRWIDGSLQNVSGPWQNDPRQFIAPLAMDPDDADTLYGGTNRVWQTNNASGAADWTPISDTNVAGGGTLLTIAPAPGPTRVVYTGSTEGEVWRLDGDTWTNRSTGLPGGRITDIVISPDDPDVAYVANRNREGRRILRTGTGGPFWFNVTGDLPEGYGITALAVDWRHDPPLLFAGTGAGVFASLDGGDTWIKDGLDLPNVNVGDLVVDVPRGNLVAGTYGRGTWVARLPEPPAPCPADLDGSGGVDTGDLLSLLASWGPCGDCAADLDADGTVGINDLFGLLAAWGDCPA